MKMYIRVVSLICFLSGVSFGQTNGGIDTKVKEYIDSTYNAKIKDKKIVGASIAIVKDGEILYATGYGFQDLENNIPADENTIFRIGSCTKSFTALSVMQLQEASKLKVSDPIQKHLSSVKIEDQAGKENPILIKDIMSHQSGMASDLINGFFCDNPPTIDWTIDQMNKTVMSAPPNYMHSYSNVGYSLLGRLVENVSMQEYEAYLKEHIFDKLDMKSTFVSNEAPYLEQLSKGYLDEKNEFSEPSIRDRAAGLIHSSVIDMANYLNMFLGRGTYKGIKVAENASIADMEKNALTNIELPTSEDWGFGLTSKDIYLKQGKDSISAKIIGHGGDTWVFHADFKYIPELNIGAIVLTNTKSGSRIANAKALLALYLKETDGTEIKVKGKEVQNKGEELCQEEEILGYYSLGGMCMNVKNPDKIKIKVSAAAKLILKPVNDSLRYAAKVRLLGFIPIRIKHQEYRFVKKNGTVYFKVIHTNSENEDYASAKMEVKAISSEWKNHFGNYEVTGDQYPCADCPFLNFNDLKLEITEEMGLLVAKVEGTSKDTKENLILREVSDSVAVTIGIGRGSGVTVRMLENGNLFYSGFEFIKID